ncbi:MAG: hypothetical protein H0U74_13945 [Bradymonadaceae bacterium]|nr:hypothetical protein [Lujinxingiaceae bacterium]
MSSEAKHMGWVAVAALLGVLVAGCSSDPEALASTDIAVADLGVDVAQHDTASADIAADAPSDVDAGVDAGERLVIPQGCNPLAWEHDCMLPYPSNYFLVDDASLPGGKRVALSEEALPRTKAQVGANFYTYHPADGFSHHMPILALFPHGVSTANVVFHTDDPAPTLTPQNTTLLIEADTGQAVAHWAELDHSTMTDAHRAFVIRPYNRLKNRTRYIVAIQALRDRQGALIEVPRGFGHIRDADQGVHPTLDAELARYEQTIFPVLVDFGVARADLQLAWDFTTESEEHVTNDLLTMRSSYLASVPESGPQVTIDRVRDEVDANIFRHVTGTLRVPLYLEDLEPGGRLNRDASGQVVANGEVEVPFSLQIPRSVAERGELDPPARLLQYGHGFFGSREEADGSYVRKMANDLGFVVVTVDWWGMSSDDRIAAADRILQNASEALLFTDRVHQAMINALAVGEAARTSFKQVEAFSLDGRLVFDPDHLYFHGNSQGHILGGTFVALSPRIERAVLGVGGASFSLMMSRSTSFRELLALIVHTLVNRLDVQKYIALTQSVFDRIDPLTYAPLLIERPLAGTPANRRILMHVGIADTSVPNLASHLHARAIGLALLVPFARSLPQMATAAAPFDGSALVEVDYGIDPIPDLYAAVPPSNQQNGVHEGTRRNPKVLEQLDAFLRPGGLVVNFCDQACDPE